MRRALVTGAVVALGAATLVAIPVLSSFATEGDPSRATRLTAEEAVAAADTAVAAHRAQFAASANDAFTVFRVIMDADGASHVRYTRSYRGLRVYGGDIVVHLRSDGSLGGASVGLAAPLDLAVTPHLTATSAATTARQAFVGTVATVGTAELIVDASSGVGRLAYETVVSGVGGDAKTPSVLHVRTDASSGGVLGSADEIKHVDGSGNSLYAGGVTISTTQTGGVYTLTDPTHGEGFTCDMNNGIFTCSTMNDADNVWGNGTNSSRQSAAVDAHYGAALTFDYFKNVHGRNGIFDDGTGVPSRVHFDTGYVNAFWDGSQMTYGDGAGDAKPLTSIDVAGHEMTHGVTENVVPGGLIYAGESGGLNEATSDIFATMVEFYAANPADPADYLIGEKIDINGDGTPLRYMHDPALDGLSHSCWSPATEDADVHFSSGVANHFFFMLAEGSGATAYGNSPTCGGAPDVTGIGRTAAAAIWFRALDQYFTSTTRYVNDAVPGDTARNYTLAAASTLFGACSSEYEAVRQAWDAVNVFGGDVNCNASDLLAAMTAPGTPVISAEYLETTSGQPNGVISSDLAGFPTSGGSFAVLSTGDYALAGQPNTSPDSGADNGGPATHGDSAFDITVLKIDFTVPAEMNCLRFDFKFLSEEYQEFVGTVFNDAFVAELDTTNWSTVGSEIFAPDNFAFDPTGAPITINASGLTSMIFAQALGTTYDGATPILTAAKQVTPGAHSLYLSIFDQGDHIYDSAVFIDNLAVGFSPDPGAGCIAGAHAVQTPGALASLAPARILDTRNGTGAPAGKVSGGGVLELDVAGNGGVPETGASAVVLNVTVTQPSASGYLTVFPTGTAPPLASNLNFTAGQTIPNLVTVLLGVDGHVSIKNGSSAGVHMIADVAGFYLDGDATSPGSFVPLAPERLLDTRFGNGAPIGKLAGLGVLELQIAGRGGVPETGASAVILNVTVTQPGSNGYITVFPTGTAPPLASNLNFKAGKTIPNLVVVKLGTDGKVSLKNGGSAGAHLIADVAGYYLAGGATEPGAFVPLEPSRLLDTRNGTGAPVGKVGGTSTLDLIVAGQGGVPPTGAVAVVLNVTVTQPGSNGFLTVFPTGGAPPLASNLNFTSGLTIANLVTVQLGADGQVSFRNGGSAGTHIIADIAGYYLAW